MFQLLMHIYSLTEPLFLPLQECVQIFQHSHAEDARTEGSRPEGALQGSRQTVEDHQRDGEEEIRGQERKGCQGVQETAREVQEGTF